jgi:hypothetical protein
LIHTVLSCARVAKAARTITSFLGTDGTLIKM